MVYNNIYLIEQHDLHKMKNQECVEKRFSYYCNAITLQG